jgi:hypothetical protein
VLLIALLGAARILALCLALPFFGNVDEYRHVDMALKYARGFSPVLGDDRYEPELSQLIGRYGSPEYHRDPVAPRLAELPPPTWRAGPEVASRRIADARALLSPRHNLEAYGPPLYYAIAGAWWSAGRALGLEEGARLYWLRGLSALFGFALVLAAWLGLREIYPEAPLLRIGVPLLVALFPQDCVVYVTGDALSPLLGGIGFLLVVRLALRPAPGAASAAFTGTVVAAALLTKYPNAALVPVLAFATLVAWTRRPTGNGRDVATRWLVAWTVVLLPLVAWLARNQLVLGDATGSAWKAERLGWGRKPLTEIWDHPLFTPAGLADFVSSLVPRFWRGEVAWYQATLASPPADLVYTISTLLFLALAAVALRDRTRGPAPRVAEGAAFVHVVSAVGILAVLSLLFVFGETTNPPASRPFFDHGRLIAGAMLPFALLFVRGISVGAARLPERLSQGVGWALLAAVCVVASVSELALWLPVFSSPYNFYHLP